MIAEITDGDTRKITVLVVEDDESHASMVSRLLIQKFKAKVEVAKDLADARKALALRPFDLICLDYQLPDGDGFELLDEADPDDMPNIIVITGHTGEGLEAAATEKGALGFVPKDPRMPEKLVEEVRRLLQT